MTINKDDWRRFKWIIAFIIVFLSIYFAPYEVYSEKPIAIPFFGSIFSIIALYQIYGNYSNFIEFLDSLLTIKSQKIIFHWLYILIPTVLFFFFMINYSKRSSKELFTYGQIVKANVDLVEMDILASRSTFLNRHNDSYWVYYSYTVDGVKYHNKTSATDKIEFDYLKYRKVDSIDIVYSKKHHNLSEMKYHLDKMK